MIIEDLYKMQDKKYAIFQQKLTPTISIDKFIGVRVPILRKYAKEIKGTKEAQNFLKQLSHKYYDENMLHSLLISEIKDYDLCIEELNKFLPYVDNWAVCDIMSPKVLKKDLIKTLDNINKWIISDHNYTIRFGIEMLMSFYLDDNFKKEYLDIPLRVKSNEYYVNMMIAWFYATALTKQWDDTIYIIENKLLDKWVHNKTISKARESLKISKEHKEYLNNFKIKV